MVMTELSIDLIVAAAADQVWDVIGHQFDRIGDWATAIPRSTALADATATAAGRGDAGRDTRSSTPPSVAASVRPASGSFPA